MRCAIYTRVSTEEQAKEGYSLSAQEERLRAYAKSQGWSVYKIYVDDGYSAASKERPALKRLLLDSSLKRFDIVLVYKIDRLSRSLKDLIEIVAELNRFDVGFKSCTELIDTTRPEGRLMFHQFGSFAQYERELISQRTRFGMMKRLRQGLWNGQAPYGYTITDGKLAVDEKEVNTVKMLFELYLKKNMGVVAISRELNRVGIKPRRGRMWKGNTIHNILTNPLYAGFVRWGGEMAEGSHKPIIEKDMFNHVQDTLKQRNHKTRGLRTSNYLTGLVRCGKCNSLMHVTYPGIEPKSRFRYYVCNNRYYFKSCDQDYIRADILEGSIIKEIEKLSLRQDVIASLVEDYVSYNRARLPRLEGEKREVLNKLELLEGEKERLSRWLLKNAPSPEAVRYLNSRVDEFSEREKNLQEELWRIEDEINTIHLTNYNARGIGDYLRDFIKAFTTDLDSGERKLLIESLVNKVKIGGNKKVTFTLQPPLKSLGFLSPSLALRGEIPKMDFTICIEYSVMDYYEGTGRRARVFTQYSKQEYTL
jgi:site-specific DNA recombinase